MSSQVIEGWKPIRGTPGKTIVTQNSDGSYTVTIDPSAIGDGSGDMLKAVYDIDGNDIVDAAESVPWTGVTGKPLVFPPDAHTHDDRYYTESETDTLLGGYILESTFDANSLLIANTDDTPVALSVGASTIVGRGAAGGIAALSAAEVAAIVQGSIDHGSIAGLTDDDHTGYALLAGRAGGQTIIGGTGSGDDLILQSTSNATKGDVLIQTDGGNVGIGTTSPFAVLDVVWNSNNSRFYLFGSGLRQENAGDSVSGPAPLFTIRRSRGSLAAPTALLSGDYLGVFQMGGHNGTSFSSNSAGLLGVATENWGTGRGSQLQIFTANNGATFGTVKMTVDQNGNVGIGTTSPTVSDGVGVDINGKILRLRTSKTPSSASDTGNVGEICWDSGALYICVATDTWKKAAIATW